LRDETLSVLGIDNVDALRDGIPPLDHAAALAQAIAWLGERNPGERSLRLWPLLGGPASKRGAADRQSAEVR
jgi:hypothetical protein